MGRIVGLTFEPVITPIVETVVSENDITEVNTEVAEEKVLDNTEVVNSVLETTTKKGKGGK